MDTSGEAADLVVKESIQLTEASIKLLAAGSKNLAAFLYALAKDNKKLVGKTSMNRLLREGKELKSFCIKEEDFAEFRKYARPNVLFAAVQDTKANDGLVALVTNTDFVPQVNLFMQRRGYDRGECDLDAQSISYILCRRYGIERPMPDMTNLAGLYEGWEPQERRQALDTIQDTSKQFGRSIEKNLEMGKQRSRAPVHRPTR